MTGSSTLTRPAEPVARGPLPAPTTQRGRGFVAVAILAIITLVLGGMSVARAATPAALDALVDLEFSLDGSTWSTQPDAVLGSWGCDLAGTPSVPDPGGAIGSSGSVDPCSMARGEYIDRTYYVRNATDSGQPGRYAVGVGDFRVSEDAEFDVSSTITGSSTAESSNTVPLFGPGTSDVGGSTPRGTTVSSLVLAPGQSARVVDKVSVPTRANMTSPRQSVTPMMWVSFDGLLDTDRDNLPDVVEDEIGTDYLDPYNTLPPTTVGSPYGPEPFLPTPPQDTVLNVDESTLPPGIRLEDGNLVGEATRPGVYDIEFTVAMPDGGTYTSIRRVVIERESGSGGSVDLPDWLWPIIVIVIIIGGGTGSLGSLGGGSLGSLGGGSPGGSLGSLGGGSLGGALGSLEGSIENALGSLASPGGSLIGPGSLVGEVSDSLIGPGSLIGGLTSSNSVGGSTPPPAPAPVPPAPAPGPGSGGSAAHSTVGSTGSGTASHSHAGAGSGDRARQAAPSAAWQRANSQVRGELATTGVDIVQLVLWSLTALAAGMLLMFLFRRRDSDPDGADTDQTTISAP